MKRTLSTTIAAVAILFATGAANAQTWSFDAAPGGSLEIDLRTGGSIEIRSGEAAKVTVQAELHGRDAERIVVEAEKTARGVRVVAKPAHGMSELSASADVTVTVPARYDVDIASMGGGISIEGVEGRFDGQTMGGGLQLRGLKGHLTLTTMGGNVDVSDSDLDGKVSTMGGNVTFRRVAGDLKGTTMGGRVRILDAPADAPAASSTRDEVVEISTMGGDIDVASAPRGAHVSTMGGDIRIDSAREFVEAKTMGGKIRIGEVDGRVQATTMGGDIEAHVIGEGGSVQIESMSGDLEIWLPADFAGTFDVEIAYTQGERRTPRIRSDFALQESRTENWEYGHGSPRKFIRGSGTTGAGTHEVYLHTVNGDIIIHRGG